jgi:baseplate J-like protein
MFQVEDEPKGENEPIETIHLYVVREGEKHPSLVPVILSILTLVSLIAVGIVTPYKQPEVRKTIRVPAIFLPLKPFTTSVSVISTGVKTYPATTAHGTLTITNGSILSEELPKGMIFTGKDGVEVITDQAVFVPAGSASGYGVAYVSAHAATSGKSGNIATLDIDSVEGTALYMRNLAAFTGGADSYSVKFVTAQDRETALSKARAILLPQTFSGLLDSPCKETITGNQTLSVTWTCQFVTYTTPSFPGIRVIHAQVMGKVVLLDIVYLPRPQRIETK